MKKTIAILLALTVLASAFAQGSSESPKAAEPAAKGPSSISVCIASEPDTIDPALNSAVDGATLTDHLFSDIAKWDKDTSRKHKNVTKKKKTQTGAILLT